MNAEYQYKYSINDVKSGIPKSKKYELKVKINVTKLLMAKNMKFALLKPKKKQY